MNKILKAFLSFIIFSAISLSVAYMGSIIDVYGFQVSCAGVSLISFGASVGMPFYFLTE